MLMEFNDNLIPVNIVMADDLALFWSCCNIVYPSEMHFKLKSREISFAHDVLFSCQVVLKFYAHRDFARL